MQSYVRYLIEQRRLAPSSVRVAVMGLRFFYTQTLHRPWTNLPLPKRTKTLPEVLSREEVARLLASTTTVRERALLMTTYGGGLRVSEVVRLRVGILTPNGGCCASSRARGAKIATRCWATALGRVTPLLAGVSARAAVAVPAAEPARPDGSLHRPEDVLRGQAARGDYQGGWHSRFAPCLYHPLIGRGHGSGHPATLAGPRECHDHHALRACGP